MYISDDDDDDVTNKYGLLLSSIGAFVAVWFTSCIVLGRILLRKL